jgi:hypothetical protein
MRSLRGSGATVLRTGRTAACLVIYSHAIVISCVIAAVDELSLKMKAKAFASLNVVPHHEDVRGNGALILHS